MPSEDTPGLSKISVEWEPWQIAFSPDGQRAYVAMCDPASEAASKGRVSVIDAEVNSVVTDIDIGGPFFGILGGDLAITPEGRYLYVTGAHKVTVVNTTTNQVSAVIPTPDGFFSATGVAMAPDGNRAFVLAQRGDQAGAMLIVDTSTHSIIDQVTLSFDPFGVEISPAGDRVYVSHSSDAGVMIDLETKEKKWLSFPFEGAFWMAVALDGERAYVGRDHNDNVFVCNLSTDAVKTAVPTMRNIGDVVITPDGRRVYVAQGGGHGDEPNVMVIDTSTDELTCCPASWFNAQPRGMAITPDGRHAYVADSRHREVVIVPIPEPS
ncbi:YncE family protein [Streptomyces eurythermus]